MNTTSASPAEFAAPPAAPLAKVRIWDAPVRVVHWLGVACFAGAWLSAESERWRQVHITLGWTLAALVVFRLAWGLGGSRHARFASFVRGPAAVARYLGALLRGRPEHHVGHNPAGAWATLALLAGLLGVAASGWAVLSGVGGEALGELHEALASALLALVGVHVAAVLLSSHLHRENLVGAMVTGQKPAPADQAIPRSHRLVALAVLAAVLGFWAWQWQQAPQGLPAGIGRHVEADGDDD